MVKLKEIPGLIIIPYAPDNDQGILSEDEMGFNQALTQQGEVELTMDREKLAGYLWNNENLKTKVIQAEVSYRAITYRECLRIADAIISNLKDLLIVVGKEKI